MDTKTMQEEAQKKAMPQLDTNVYIDENGRYYKAQQAKNASDASKPFAEKAWRDALTEEPIKYEEMLEKVRRAEIENENLSKVETKEIKLDVEPEVKVIAEEPAPQPIEEVKDEIHE